MFNHATITLRYRGVDAGLSQDRKAGPRGLGRGKDRNSRMYLAELGHGGLCEPSMVAMGQESFQQRESNRRLSSLDEAKGSFSTSPPTRPLSTSLGPFTSVSSPLKKDFTKPSPVRQANRHTVPMPILDRGVQNTAAWRPLAMDPPRGFCSKELHFSWSHRRGRNGRAHRHISSWILTNGGVQDVTLEAELTLMATTEMAMIYSESDSGPVVVPACRGRKLQ